MTTFLTGGTGFIGAHIARALVARGDRVRCLVRPTSRRDNLRGLPVELVEGDLTELDSIRGLVAGCETIFHCAADYRLFAADPNELYRNNVDGTRNLLQAAADGQAKRVVYTSTVGTLHTGDDGLSANEENAGALDEMVGDYKRSKLLAEREVGAWVERGLAVVTVSPATAVGELDARPTPTGEIIVDFLNGRMPAYVDTGLNLIDVRDVAAGHLLAAERGAVGRNYILANQNFAFKDLLALLARLTGLPAPRVRLPGWLPVAIAHVEARLGRWRSGPPRISLEAARMARQRMFFDGGRAVRELGLPQSPIEPALARAISWFVEHGYARRPLPLPATASGVEETA
jgi:dihydroflavonol-4-reductase